MVLRNMLLTLCCMKMGANVSDFIDLPYGCNIKSGSYLIEGLHMETPHDLEVARESNKVFEFVMQMARRDSQVKKVQELIERQVTQINILYYQW